MDDLQYFSKLETLFSAILKVPHAPAK